MNIEKEDVKIDSICELLKKCKVDDGTFSESLYNLYLFIGLTKGIDDIRNGRGITLEELRKEMEERHACYSRRFSIYW